MKYVLLLLVLPLLAGKGMPVNAAYLGKYSYYDTEKKQTTTWLVSRNPKAADKIDFRRTTDKEALFTAEMKDATHFKTKHDFTEHVADNTDVKRTCAGYFGNSEMTLLIGYETITFGIRKNLVNQFINEHTFKKVNDDGTIAK